MGRPRASEEQRLYAYRLHNQSFKPTAIHNALKTAFGETETPVSLRTVKGWLKEFRSIGHEITAVDQPFHWELLDEYNIPWDASSYLLAYWSEMIEQYHELGHRPLSIREMTWVWRVHLAEPSLNFYEVRELSLQFVARELFRDVLGEDWGMDDLWGRLAFRPWAGDIERESYDAAVESGAVPALMKTFDVTGRRLWSALAKASDAHNPFILAMNRLAEAGDAVVLIEQRDFSEE